MPGSRMAIGKVTFRVQNTRKLCTVHFKCFQLSKNENKQPQRSFSRISFDSQSHRSSSQRTHMPPHPRVKLYFAEHAKTPVNKSNKLYYKPTLLPDKQIFYNLPEQYDGKRTREFVINNADDLFWMSLLQNPTMLSDWTKLFFSVLYKFVILRVFEEQIEVCTNY